MNSLSFEQQVLSELAALMEPVTKLDSVTALTGLIGELGWHTASGAGISADVGGLAKQARGLVSKAEAMATAATSEELMERASELAEDCIAFFDALRSLMPSFEAVLRSLPDLVGSQPVSVEKLQTRLLDYLLFEYLSQHKPRLFACMFVLGLVERMSDESGASVRSVRWDRLPMLFTDLHGLADSVYDWSSDFKADVFLERVSLVMQAFLLPGGIYPQDGAVRSALHRDSAARELRIPLYQGGRWPTNYRELDINVSALPALVRDGVELRPGLALYPNLLGMIQQELSVFANWSVRLRGQIDLNAGLGVELRPPHNLEFTTELFGGTPLSQSDGRLELDVVRNTEAQRPYYIFGSEGASHAAVRQAAFKAILAASAAQRELSVELEINGLTLALTTESADAFVAKLLSGLIIRAAADLAIGYSNLNGVYFRGSGALEVEIPLQLDFGVLQLNSLFIAVAIHDGFDIRLAASLSAELGPTKISLKHVGLRIPIGIAAYRAGNLGPLQVDEPRFLPPTGAGLSLAAGAITGGGFLDFDEPNGLYSGVLSLRMYEIGLVAVALITTKLPDGSQGYSLLVNISVQFSPPIQLTFGFTLLGVGGLIGINRTMDVEALQRGVRQGTLESILFPDPAHVIENAAQIISDMRTVFPAAEGRVVIGPMVKIGWGTPRVITADIGIFLELPAPVRIALMGRLSATLPSPDKALVAIHLDVLGILDLEKQELTFQASLYDSRILSFALSGDAAFLLNWSDQPQFALSLGGFHPKFPTPSPAIIFADMKRLTLALSSGKAIQLTCKTYMAITPNSIQFGARADLHASAMGASIRGHLAFDALFYLSPFSFEVQISAGVSIKYQGVSLCEVGLSFNLSGPTPWVARGSAKIKILFFSVKVRFCIKWGDKEAAELPAVDLWDALQKALEAPESWGTVLPSGRELVESLREGEKGSSSPELLVHPAGRLEVRQTVAPLCTNLSKAGSAPIKDHDRFEIQRVIVEGRELATDPVEEFFARGQFEDMSPSKKLAVPAFERMPAGVRSAGSTEVRSDGEPEAVTLAYESILIGEDRTSSRQSSGEADWEDAQVLIATQSQKRAAQRGAPRDRYAPKQRASRARAVEERYAIVDSENLVRIQLEEPNRRLTRVRAEQLLDELEAKAPGSTSRWMLVPEYEVREDAA